MRITYIHQYFNTPEMSGSTRSYEMARRLVAAGHQVHMVTSWREPDRRKNWFVTDEAGIQVHWLPLGYSNRLAYGQRVKAFLSFAVASAFRAASLPGDVVFASSTPLTVALPGIYASRRLGVPMVFEVRDLWPELPIAVGAIRSAALKWLACRLERVAYQSSAAIVALSPGMKDGVVSTGYPADRVTVIPNGADLDLPPIHHDMVRETFRARLGIPREAVLVVYTGTLGKINGVGYLANLANAMRSDPGVYFLTVGDGQEFESVKAQASASGCLDRNFFMLRQVPKREVPAITVAADVAVSTVIPLPELEANCANKFFDALAAGRCVAINHGGWQEELLVANGAGFRLSRNIVEAADQLRVWSRDPSRIRDAGRRARRLAEDLFSRDQLAVRLEKLLQSLVEKR
jgi:glycosyltransferase involved in cell wall biosynthesis